MFSQQHTPVGFEGQELLAEGWGVVEQLAHRLQGRLRYGTEGGGLLQFLVEAAGDRQPGVWNLGQVAGGLR